MLGGFNNIAIIGLGLIGSSIARKLKACDHPFQVYGYGHNLITINTAIELGIITKATTSLKKAVEKADLVIICTPLSTYEALIPDIFEYAPEHAVITDVGSVKMFPLLSIFEKFPDTSRQRFVPGHPIAGSEKSGVRAGREDLFQGKVTILTPLKENSEANVACVTSLWELCGARVTRLSPMVHDRSYAQVSHLTQLISFAYLDALFQLGEPILRGLVKEMPEYFIPFFRLTGSSPVIWKDIFIYNKNEIVKALDTFSYHYFMCNENIKKGNESAVTTFIDEARHTRSPISNEQSFSVNWQSQHPVVDGFVFTHYIPFLLAATLCNIVDDVSMAGTGFRDFTSYIGYNPLIYNDIEKDSEEFTVCNRIMMRTLDKFYRLMLEEDGQTMYKVLTENIAKYEWVMNMALINKRKAGGL